MMGRRLVLAAAVVASVAGCGTEHVALAADRTPAGKTAGLPVSVTRLQQAENDKPSGGSLLDVSYKESSTGAEIRVSTRIRASVNGIAILDNEVREAAGPYLMETLQIPEPERSVKQKEIVTREINRLVEREVILQDAFTLLGKRPQFLDKLKQSAGKEFDKQLRSMKKRFNIASDDDLRASLKQQGLSLDGIRRQVERNYMAMEYMRSRIFPAIDRITPEQILEYYQQHPAEFEVTDSVKWQDIFIDAGRFPGRDLARQFAEDLLKRAQAGEDFQQLALKYDNGDSSYRNGEGFGTRKGEIKPGEVEPVVFSLKEGQLGPLVEFGNGWHLVRVAKREYAGRMPFDEKTQLAIKNKLISGIWEREYKRILADLRRKASIEIATLTP